MENSNKCTSCDNILSSDSNFCDKCGNKIKILDNSLFLQLGQVTQSLESALIRIILICTKELDFPFGINSTIQILRGSASSKIMKHNLQNLQSYGILAFFPAKSLKRVINNMINSKMLAIEQLKELDYQGNPLEVLKIHRNGIEFLDSDINKPFFFITELSEKTLTLLKGADLELYEALLTLRNSLVEKDLPTYTVCSNGPVAHMALEKPITLQELSNIKGIGQKFLEKYGQKFLDLIKIWQGN